MTRHIFARLLSGQLLKLLPVHRSSNPTRLSSRERDRLGCVTQIRVRATCQRDEFSLCTSKFESDMASHAVGLARWFERTRLIVALLPSASLGNQNPET